MDNTFYLNDLYPLQDEVLKVITQTKTGFYLTGGTALSRGYLQHRFSDDLDLFTNMHPQFGEWGEVIIAALAARPEWRIEVQRRATMFLRLFVHYNTVALKIECVNDVPAHIGTIKEHPVLGRLDSPENILANKVTALIDRDAPKDVADIWGLCYTLGLSLKTALTDASSKASGIYPPLVARRLFAVNHQDWEVVRWITPPNADQFVQEVKALAESLILVE